jgi:shikimate dehydrogenase
VIGWPIAHSRSPLIHNYWLERYGIAGAYRSEAVPPDRFAAFVKSLAQHGYVGANVTVPHKEAALACARPDDHARAVGAANTLWLDGGECAPPIPMSKAFSATSTPARRAGTAK